MAKDENYSGDKETMNTGADSKLCRLQLLWILDAIAPAHARLNTGVWTKELEKSSH